MNNLIGQKFERLIVLKRMDNDKWGKSCWLCECDCGKEKIVIGSDLKSGNTKSCGCLAKEKLIKRLTKHGHSTTTKVSKTYISWADMIQRCTNPNHKDYHNYGGRGIKVSKRWVKFENFLEDMGEPPTDKHTLDRISNDGNYCKSNCRWATRKEQSRNTRRNRLITYKGKTQCLIEWAEELGINYSTLKWRLCNGWSIERAFETSTKNIKNITTKIISYYS